MRKRKPEEHENLDRWLLTYSDMITLLMAFFIMMYSMSVLNLAKFRQAAFSIRSGFGGIMQGQGKSLLGTSGEFGAKPTAIVGDTAGAAWKVIKPLVDYVGESENLRRAGTQIADVSQDERGIVISVLTDSLLFEPGSAVLKKESLPLMDKISETLDGLSNNILVEGHTCDLQPRGSRYPTNWELSTARATTVLRYLVEAKGLDAKRFSAAGYASMRPIVSNEGEKLRKKNRRVEIVILKPGLIGADMPSNPETDKDEIVIQRRSGSG